jgi:hypothetical protein
MRAVISPLVMESLDTLNAAVDLEAMGNGDTPCRG